MRISFTTANFVARETGYAMHGWGHGDRLTNEAFAPVDTYAERIDALFADVRRLGFDAVDLWGAHLHPEWATDAHVDAARAALAQHGVALSTYAPWVGPSNAERACELARALGTTLVGAGFSGDPDLIASTFERHGVRLAVENHAQKTPAELPQRFGVTVDTGWWATQGYDPVRAIEELGDRVLHVHLKDVLATGEPHESCRWGEGIVQVRECVEALKRIGFTGRMAVEHEPETVDPSEDLAAMRAELESWL